MEVRFKDDIYYITRETGSTANYLGIKIEEKEVEIKIIAKDIKPMSKYSIPLSEKNIYNDVTKIWNLYMKRYYIKEIYFFPNDSNNNSTKALYQAFTIKIIEYITKIEIQKNWEKLYTFWKKLDFETLKACHLALNKALDDDFIDTDEELKEEIRHYSLVKREFNPARNEEIEKIKKIFNVKLPKSFEESLKINVGDIVTEDDYLYSWLGNRNHLLGIEEIIKESLNMEKYYCQYKGSVSFQYLNGLAKEYSYWNKKWLVFYNCNNDEQFILNLDEKSKNYGEVLSMKMEFSDIKRLAYSYEEWFSRATKEILIYAEILFLD